MTGLDDRNMDIEPLEREAIAWVRRLTSGQATAADAEALKQWRSLSPAHAAAFWSASQLWQDLDPAGRDWRFRKKWRSPLPVNRRFVLRGGLAAASAAAVTYAMIDPPLGLWPSWAELRADYRTGTGEQREVALFDDVSVRLNTQTSLAVRSPDGAIERAELIAGEASFSTNMRAGRSFAVQAADRWVTANTAQFVVRYLREQDASVCVTCLQGVVTVERGGEATPVAARQQLRYADASNVVRLQAVDPDIASAWQNGVLIFRFAPLSEVIEEVNRYRPGRIILISSDIGREQVSGRFRIDNLDEILVRIEQALGVKAHLLPGGFVLLS